MKPADVIGTEAIAALRAEGWIIVRDDAIRLAQIAATQEARELAGYWRREAVRVGE